MKSRKKTYKKKSIRKKSQKKSQKKMKGGVPKSERCEGIYEKGENKGQRCTKPAIYLCKNDKYDKIIGKYTCGSHCLLKTDRTEGNKPSVEKKEEIKLKDEEKEEIFDEREINKCKELIKQKESKKESIIDKIIFSKNDNNDKDNECKVDKDCDERFHCINENCVKKDDKNLKNEKLNIINKMTDKKEDKKGIVYIASKVMRGKHAPLPENTLKVDVTSAQAKDSLYRRDFSPMTEIKGGYKGFFCFENYWQGYKRFVNKDKNINHLDKDQRQKYVDKWKNLKECKRRDPAMKGLKPVDAMYEDDVPIGYIESRKKIYIPQYYNLMINTVSFKKLKKMVDEGKNVAIYDFDGPKDKDSNITTLKVSEELLIEKMNDPTFPYGHGYVVAGALLGINPVPEIKK